MSEKRWTWLVRALVGCCLWLLAGLVLVPYVMGTRGPAPAVVLLCAALGGAAGTATLPFAEDGRALLLRSAAHLAVTAVLFGLLFWQLGAEGVELLAWECILFLLYAVVWLGRWVGWYAEVVQLRTLLGLAPGPSPLKWRETLPYLPFVLFLCVGLPLLLRAADHAVSVDVPVLSGLILPWLLLPAGGFCSGLSLGKRQGLCPLYPASCLVCYLPMVFLLFNGSALFHCLMVSVPALLGNGLGWLWRRAVFVDKTAKKGQNFPAE